MKGSVWRSNISFFLSYFLYWYVICLFDRTVFLITNWNKFDFISDMLYAYLYGSRLDASLICYLLVIPFLFYIFQVLFLKKPVNKWWLRGYTLLPTVLFALITIVNLPLYESWGEKISKRAILLGMGTVGGVSSSVDVGMLIQAGIVLTLYFTVAHFTYHLVVVKVAKYVKHSYTSIGLTFLLGAIFIFTLMRGGYGRANINPSTVYFSDSNVANHLAVNTYWAFLKDMTKSSKKNPYVFMEDGEAKSLVTKVLPSEDILSNSPLKSDRPNVVLILLEGMVGQVFEDLGGEKGITDNMKNLMKEGVSFTRAYAAADRSDKGMIAVMSGFPAQGTESIIQYIPKHEKLPGIGQIYDSLGYHTSFYHGGQSEFYNFKSFMYTHGIADVVDNADFGLHEQRNSWGVYDHVIADRMLHDLNASKKPFFSIFYTLVNHEPFNLDGGYKFGNNTKGNAYRSTAYYTDTMINSLVEKAKKEDWYKNTVFVVVSDHGNIYPTERYGLEHPNRYHIPLFIFGGALKDEWKGKKVDNVVSQLDVATTLWKFVSKEKSPFKYSTNLFDINRKDIAFYNSNNVFGVVCNNQAVSYDMQGKKVAYIQDKNLNQDSLTNILNISKAYYQTVFQDFLNY